MAHPPDMATTDDAGTEWPASSARMPRRWRTGAVLGAGVAGFLGGIAFWHFVGFWTVIGGILFTSRPAAEAPPVRPIAAALPARAPTGNGEGPAASKAQPAQSARHEPQPTAGHTETLADLLQCSEVRMTPAGAVVVACPPIRRRLPLVTASARGNRLLDAREAAARLAHGWETGVARIETGSLPTR